MKVDPDLIDDIVIFVAGCGISFTLAIGAGTIVVGVLKYWGVF